MHGTECLSNKSLTPHRLLEGNLRLPSMFRTIWSQHSQLPNGLAI